MQPSERRSGGSHLKINYWFRLNPHKSGQTVDRGASLWVCARAAESGPVSPWTPARRHSIRGTRSLAPPARLAHSLRMDAPATVPATPEERYALVALEVEAQLGPEVAATYMQTRNFALGGLMPTELVATEEGTRQVLAEISAHAGGGPL